MTASDGKAEITTTDPRALEREVELRRARLVGTIDELTARVAPAALKDAGITAAKAKVLGFATHRDGSLRVERVAAVAVAVLGVTTFVVVRAVRKRR